MKVKPFRIPKHIVLPGLLIKVQQAAQNDWPLEGVADGDWFYDDEGAVITLNRALRIKRKRYILLHELQHVMTDYLHDALDNHRDKIAP